MKKIFLGLSALILVLSSVVTPGVAGASSDSVSLDARKITSMEQTEQRIEYTYTEGNEEFKVVEIFNDDSDELVSTIYKKNQETGDFEVADKIESEILSNDDILIESATTGRVEVMEIDSDSDYFELQATTTWKYHGTTYGSNKPTKWTVGIIALAIASITKLPASAKFVTNAANLTFQIGKDVIYYKRLSYKSGPRLRPDFKFVTTLYSDKARTKVIKSGIVSYVRS